MLSVYTGQMKCPKWLSQLCCCCCCCKCCHDDDKDLLLPSSETSSQASSDYGTTDVTFYDDQITPTLFTIVQDVASDQGTGYQAEHSLLGNTEVQEWKVEIADEESTAATPGQYDALGQLTEYTVLPSVPPTGVVMSHSLVADSDHTTKVSYEFHLCHRT